MDYTYRVRRCIPRKAPGSARRGVVQFGGVGQVVLLMRSCFRSELAGDLTVTAKMAYFAPAVLGERDDWLSASGPTFTAVEAFGLQRMGDVARDAHGDLAAGVRMASGVVHGA